MKFLFTMQPLMGHFHAMVPLAQALKDHGHQVAFATHASFGPIVKRVDFEHFPCGRDSAGSNGTFTQLSEWPTIQARVSHPGIQQVWGFILGYGPPMVDDLIDLMSVWKPDAIVRDPVEFGGYIAAERFGIPHASIMWALYINPKQGCLEPVNELRQRYGLPAETALDSFDRYFVLHGMPDAWPFINGAPPVTHRFCMPPFDQSVKQALPSWVQTLADAPTIYATLGTTFNKSPARFRALIDALGAEELNTVITVGQSVDPSQFHPLPARVRVEQYIPQTLILPYCDAFVFHGGFNSLLSSLWHGLPVVVMPLEAGDQRPTAEQCAALGVGILVDDPLDPVMILTAIKTILTQASFRLRAAQFQQDIADLSPLSDAVERLERMVQTREPQFSDVLD